MLRLTETRGSRSWPAAAQASRNRWICSACSWWNGTPVSSVSSVELIRFMPWSPSTRRSPVLPAPHQIRSRRPGGVRFDPQQPGGVGEHRTRVGPREPLALQHLQQHLGVLAGHVGVGGALRRDVAEVAVAVDDLLGRSPADAQLQPAAGDQVGRAGVLGHVQRVLVAHVDDAGADLDPATSSRRSQRAAGTASRAGGRSGAPGSRRRRHPPPRRRRPARSTAAGCPRRCAPLSAASPTSGRRTGIRSSSHPMETRRAPDHSLSRPWGWGSGCRGPSKGSRRTR